MEVLLLEKTRFRRSLSVALDGYEVVRHPSVLRMAPLFEFPLGSHAIRLEVTCGLGMSILGPLWPGNLRRFALLVDGKILYEDRLGRQVDPSVIDVL